MGNSFMEGGPTWTSDDDKKWDDMTSHIDKELDSEVIDTRLKYSKQTEVIKQSLKEAFGEYASDIKVVNRFLLRVATFMDRIQKVKNYKGPHEGAEYEAVMEGGLTGGNNIMSGIIHHGKPAIDKMKADLVKQGKTPEEITKIVRGKFDKFLSLLRERITYEP